MRVLCNREHNHLILRGSSGGSQLTKQAEAYPWGLADALALACARDCAWRDTRRRLDVAACARQTCRCIGEASHPGPPRRAPPRPRPLFPEEPIVEPQTAVLGQRAVDGFLRWLTDDLGAAADLDALAGAPRLLDLLLRSYARHLYYSDGRLYTYRHLLAFAQRRHLHLRRCLPNAWSAATAWEMLEPVQHRPPIPEALARAIIALSVSWGWLRVAATVAAIFFGITRPGEVITATRAHLVLPADCLSRDRVAYIHHVLPKTRTRGPRHQHSSIEDETTIQLLELAFEHDAPDTPLFPGSAAVFRRRFAAILQALNIPKGIFTPAGLRGGGACAAFRKNSNITLLCWRMRLANPTTLAHYLQEAAAATSLRNLPQPARRAIQAADNMLPVVLLHARLS